MGGDELVIRSASTTGRLLATCYWPAADDLLPSIGHRLLPEDYCPQCLPTIVRLRIARLLLSTYNCPPTLGRQLLSAYSWPPATARIMLVAYSWPPTTLFVTAHLQAAWYWPPPSGCLRSVPPTNRRLLLYC